MDKISFVLNGAETTVEVDAATPLLWVLRDHLGLTGTKYGCGMAVCGCCTVPLNGDAVRSCVTPGAAGDQVRGRHGGGRVLRGPPQRRCRPLVRHAGGARERTEGDDRRRAVAGPQPCRPARLARGAGAAVRLLPVGTADVGGLPARGETPADRRRHRRRDVRESLPLWNVPTHPARHPPRGRDGE